MFGGLNLAIPNSTTPGPTIRRPTRGPNYKPCGRVAPPRVFIIDLVYDPSHGLLIMFGGAGSGRGWYFNDTWAYHPATNTWTKFSVSRAWLLLHVRVPRWSTTPLALG